MKNTQMKSTITLAVNANLLGLALDESYDCYWVKEAFHNAELISYQNDQHDVDAFLVVFQTEEINVDLMIQEELELAMMKSIYDDGGLVGLKTFAIKTEVVGPDGFNQVLFIGDSDSFAFEQSCYGPKDEGREYFLEVNQLPRNKEFGQLIQA